MSGAPDSSEQAERVERARRAGRTTTDDRAVHIDETLNRLTAAHAGLVLPGREGREVAALAEPVARRPRPTAVQVVVSVLAILVFATAAFGSATKSWLGSAVRDAAAVDERSRAAAGQEGDENVLVVATDPAPTAGGRADTVSLAHVPAGGDGVVVLSLSPDLEVDRPACERWDAASATYRTETVRAEANTKLVSALDVGGPRCVTRLVQQLTGIAITGYVGIDLGAVQAMATALGGVEVCVPAPVLDGVFGPVVPDPGITTLDGLRATDFVRAGDVQGDPPSDYGRVERQQGFLAAMLGEALSGPALLDVGRMAALGPALGAALVADSAGLDEMLALAQSLQRLDAEGVRFAPAPTTAEPNSRGNTVLRAADAAALFTAVREDRPLPDQADPRTAAAGPAPSDTTVQILNASDRSGLAVTVGDTLRSLGFGIGEVRNADQPTAETIIRFSPDQAAAATLLATTVPAATTVPDPGATGVLQLVLGRSFDDVVRAPVQPTAPDSPGSTGAPTPTADCA